MAMPFDIFHIYNKIFEELQGNCICNKHVTFQISKSEAYWNGRTTTEVIYKVE